MSTSDKVRNHLPLLRRYSRALTGTQQRGDAYVVATLEAILASPGMIDSAGDVRLGLFKIFQKIYQSADVDLDPDSRANAPAPLTRFEEVARKRLRQVTPITRQALLLVTVEGFSAEEAGELLDQSPADVQSLVDQAIAEFDAQTRTTVLVIEDEPIIAMDLEQIVEDLGHSVASVASTRDEAVAAATQHRPGLVLADIQLADGSSGIDAVNDILSMFEVPVIFITAFPDRLLTGERPEPAFLITKPFSNATVQAAISQALFFSAPDSESAA